MEAYEQLRHFADSWGLLLMTLFFVAAMAWALRPGARQSDREQADIIFKHDDRGLSHGGAPRGESDDAGGEFDEPTADDDRPRMGRHRGARTRRCRAGGCGRSTPRIVFALGYVIVYPAMPLRPPGDAGVLG